MKLTQGFAIEQRDKDDASLSVGKVRLRLPQWAFWIGMLLSVCLLTAVVGFTAIQIAALRWTGRPVPFKGIIESRGPRGAWHTNTVTGTIDGSVK